MEQRQISLEEKVILVQQGDTLLQNEIIEKYQPFILKAVSNVCHSFVKPSDDVFSIGLIAFNDAIEKYQMNKGSSFLNYSMLVIKRRVIDYLRKETKYACESLDDESSIMYVKEASVLQHHVEVEEEYRKSEIEHFKKRLKEFHISLEDVIKATPKHEDARENMLFIAKQLKYKKEQREYLLKKKKLPIAEITASADISRKTLERNRTYIIAIALLLIEDYEYVKQFLGRGYSA
jgi:RNA polymerase sigma factor